MAPINGDSGHPGLIPCVTHSYAPSSQTARAAYCSIRSSTIGYHPQTAGLPASGCRAECWRSSSSRQTETQTHCAAVRWQSPSPPRSRHSARPGESSDGRAAGFPVPDATCDNPAFHPRSNSPDVSATSSPIRRLDSTGELFTFRRLQRAVQTSAGCSSCRSSLSTVDQGSRPSTRT